MGLQMNRRTQTIMVVAFLVATMCTILIWHVVAGSISAARQARVNQVVAAKDNIKLGTLLSDANLKTIGIVGQLPRGAIQDRSKVIGRGVVSDHYDGEPILESRLAAVGSGGGLAATIPSGMRVCAVKVDDVVGVAGFVTPGMRVDVLISGAPPGTAENNQGPKVKTLLQNIEVMSAGTDIQKDAEGKPHQVQVVNLLVAPEQAETLSLASSQTHIQLVLRNPLDTVIARVPGNAMANLFSGVNGVPVKPRSVPSSNGAKKLASFYTVEVINGSKRNEEKFAAPEARQ
jgi:pilus assembly protein CpaB